MLLRLQGQLNGNNGEWTNTDDVDNAERCRRHKEAKTHRVHKKDGTKTKVPEGPPPICRDALTGVCNRKNCKFIHPPKQEDPPVKELPTKQILCGLWRAQTFGVEDDQVVLVDPTITEKDGYRREYLYTYSHFNGPTLIHGTKVLFDSMMLATFVFCTIDFKVNRRVTYCNYIVDALDLKFPFPAPDPRNWSAIMKYAFSTFHYADRSLVEDSVLVYMYHLSKRMLPGVGQHVHQVAREVVETRMTLSAAQRGTLESCNSDFINDWKFNGRWSVCGSKCFRFDYDGEDIRIYPSFLTQVNVKPYLYMTAFTHFVGYNNTPYYEVNGYNFTPAISRMFKSRDDEEELYTNQCSYLQMDPLRSQHVLSLADCELDDNIFRGRKMKPKSRAAPRRREYELPPYDPRMETIMKELLDVDSEIMETTLDSLRATGIWIYQSSYMRNAVRVCDALLDAIYSPFYYLYDHVVHVGNVVQLPTPKKRLYQYFYGEEKTLHQIMENRGEWELKLKKEAGKFGKAPRLFGSGGPLCLVDKIAPELLKKQHSMWVYLDDIIPNDYGLRFGMQFCQCQEADASDRMFKSLSEYPDGVYCLYSGDDGFVAVKEGDDIRYIETDIKSCDSSNGPFIFAMTHAQLEKCSGRANADKLIKQCTFSAKFVNPSEETEYVLLQPESFFEYSGHVLTTALNNNSCRLIFSCAYLELCDGKTIEQALLDGAKRAGFSLTVSPPQRDANKISFLKRSFDGKRSYVNYGTIFRSLGLCEGAPSHMVFGWTYPEYINKTDEQLLERMIQMRVEGLVHEPVSSVINALRVRIGMEELPIELNDAALASRYECCESDITEFCISLMELKVGMVVTSTFIQQVLKIDYGIN